MSVIPGLQEYQQSIRNLAACGIDTRLLQLPILDWTRTDCRYEMADGSEGAAFRSNRHAAFELHILESVGGGSRLRKKSSSRRWRGSMPPVKRTTESWIL